MSLPHEKYRSIVWIILIGSCILSLAGWKGALWAYEQPSISLFFNARYINTAEPFIIHMLLIITVPLISSAAMWWGVRRFQWIINQKSRVLHYGIVFAALIFALYTGIVGFALAILAAPDQVGIRIVEGEYQITFEQQYRYDPVTTSKLNLKIELRGENVYMQTLAARTETQAATTQVCHSLAARRDGKRIYLLCDNESITQRTTYIDVEAKTVYAGWDYCHHEVALDRLALNGAGTCDP